MCTFFTRFNLTSLNKLASALHLCSCPRSFCVLAIDFQLSQKKFFITKRLGIRIKTQVFKELLIPFPLLWQYDSYRQKNEATKFFRAPFVAVLRCRYFHKRMSCKTACWREEGWVSGSLKFCVFFRLFASLPCTVSSWVSVINSKSVWKSALVWLAG